MQRLATVLAALLFLSSTAYGQDRYYYSDQRKIPIEKSESWKVVKTAPDVGPALTRALASRSDLRLRKALDTERGFYWLAASGGQALDAAALDGLASQVQIERSFPVFFRLEPRGDTTRFAMTDEFRVQFEDGVTRAEIDEINTKYGVEIFLEDARDEQQARDYNEYLLRVTEASPLSTLEVANRYYESELTKWSLPNFYTNYRLDGHRASGALRTAPQRTAANDPLYDEQYYLHNTSNNLGTADVDIDAPEAWDVTKGSSSITVAVFDDGIEQHEDFYSGQIVSGYTVGGGDGTPQRSSDSHGQAVAGIIAANHNAKGVRGVAPNVKIMPVKMLDVIGGVTPDEVEDVIDDAWQNGADVLSNSWSGPEDDGIEAAFIRARENGRNGKGSVIVKSAGNTGNDVTFPATVPGMLVVGAVDRDDNKWYYTPDDSEVDIVAPSGDLSGNGDVRTTDRMGSEGYVSGDYYDSFGGTSAAAPQAAGVAALMLSLNSSMSESLVRGQIESTATDYGSTSWDGSGRLNAFQAVLKTLYVTLSGPGSLGSGDQGTWTASITGGSGSTSYSWEYQPPGSSSWNSKGSCSGSSSCSYTFYNSTSYTQYAKIRVTVTDNSRTAQDTKTIAINPPEGPGPLAVTDRSERRDVAVRGPVSETAESRTVELRWSTTGPLPSSTFVVEHRADSTAAWSKLGTVAARDSARSGGAGGPAYRFRTDRLEVGTHQFRLAFEPSGQAKAQDWTSEPTTTRIELERPYQLSTYPNPARQQATVELAVKERQPVTIRLYDVLGRQVETLHRGPVPAHTDRRLRVDVSEMELSSGTYFLRVRGETFTATTKLTVAR